MSTRWIVLLLPAVLNSALTAQGIQEQIDGAAPGDTVFVAPGVYAECLVITMPLTLLAARDVTVRGSCDTSVIVVRAPSTTIKGFTLEGSGSNLAREHSGIWTMESDDLVLEDNELRDVLFGIYVKQSHHPIVRGNTIHGKLLPTMERGDGIRFWYSRGALVEDNDISRSRDLVIWFSDSAVVRHNTVVDSRYGLHYMYSHHSTFENNQFLRNEVGAFLMYSNDITFRRNTFAYARGLFGKGLGFKDADEIVAQGNVIVKNSVGLYLDNSPASSRVTNRFTTNTVAYNDVGVGLLPAVRNNVFTENEFLHNGKPVAVTGGGTATNNEWRSNYWTEYAGFDADGNGVGDTPFAFARWSDDLFDRHEELQLFALSPAARAADLLSRVLPSLGPTAVVVDSAPQIHRFLPTSSTTEPHPWLPASLFFLGAATAAFIGMRAGPRRR